MRLHEEEEEVDGRVVNPAAKKADGKKTPKKKKSGKKRSGGKRKKSSGGKRRSRRSAGRTSRRRGRRTRNPGLDVAGTSKAFLGGALTPLVTTPAAHLAGMALKDDGMGKQAVRAAAGGAVGAGLGLVVSTWSPSIGKGIAGAGGAKMTDELLAGVANTSKSPKDSLLRKAGFAMKALPDGVFVKDGVLFKTTSAGQEQLLLGFAARPIQLQMDDGSKRSAMLLGGMGNDALILDPEGEVRVLAGAMGAITEAYPNPQAGRMGAPTPKYPNPQAGTSGDYSEETYS